MSAPMLDVGALYQRYRNEMWAVAYSALRGTGQEHLAGDVVHDVVLDLLTRPPAAPVKNWTAYLVRACRNKATDKLRSAHYRHGGGPLEAPDHPPTVEFIAEDVVNQVGQQLDGARLWDALALLDPRDRQILWEYKANQRPRDDVARQFGVSPSRVSQIVTAAMETLRERLKEEGVER